MTKCILIKVFIGSPSDWYCTLKGFNDERLAYVHTKCYQETLVPTFGTKLILFQGDLVLPTGEIIKEKNLEMSVYSEIVFI